MRMSVDWSITWYSIQGKEYSMTNVAGKNAETVRRGYDAFNKADMKTLNELFDDNVSWHTPGRSALAGDRKGREAVFAQFGRYGGETAGTFKAIMQTVAETDDGRVIATHHNTATRKGKRLELDSSLVFEFKDGKVTSGREYAYDLYAWDEFWS